MYILIIAGLVVSCSTDESEIQLHELEEMSIEQRNGCTIEITQPFEDPCQVEFIISEGCAQPAGVIGAMYPPGLTFPVGPNGFNLAYDGNFCVTVTDALGCTSTNCLEIEGCGENPHPCDCEVEFEYDPINCTLLARPIGDCGEILPGDFSWDVMPDVDPATLPFFGGPFITPNIQGLYCVSFTDHNGCIVSGCFDAPGCPECDCVVELTQNGCELIAIAGEGCNLDETTNFNWTLNGNPIPQSALNELSVEENGTYCVQVIDLDGCEANSCILVDNCEKNCDDCVLEYTHEFSSNPWNNSEAFIMNKLEVRLCDEDEQYSENIFLCEGDGIIYHNTSNCPNQSIIDYYNSHPTLPNSPLNFVAVQDYFDCLEEEVKAIPGCEDASLDITINQGGGLFFELIFDCETCWLSALTIQTRGFQPKQTCDKWKPHGFNGYPPTHCGFCWD